MELPQAVQAFDISRVRTDLAAVNLELQSPDAVRDQRKFAELSMDYKRLSELVEIFDAITTLHQQYSEAMLLAQDPEMAEMASAESDTLLLQLEKQLNIFAKLTTPRLLDDEKAAVIEVRAGTGGVEASLFAEEVYRMYLRYLNTNKYPVEELSVNYNEEGGIKEATFGVNKLGAFGELRFESGVHRVQRVPKTEAAGRIHTSAISVVVLPFIAATDVKINPADLRIDVYRAGGPGGQSVNTTDSAVRITHLPTGIVVTSQDGKSQHKNKDKAMSVLASKLYDMQYAEQEGKSKTLRMDAIQGGDRSAKIRTYNFPQGRITDHRIHQSWYNLNEVLEGEVGEIVELVNTTLRQNPDQIFASDDE